MSLNGTYHGYIPEDIRPGLAARNLTEKYSFRSRAYWELTDKEGNRIHTLERIIQRESQLCPLMAKTGKCRHVNKAGGCDYGHHDITFDGGVQARRIIREHKRAGKEKERWEKVHRGRRLEDNQIRLLRIMHAQDARISAEGRKARWEISQSRKKSKEESLNERIAELEEQVRRGKRARKKSPSISPNTSSPERDLPTLKVPTRRATSVLIPSVSENSGEALEAIKKRLEEAEKESELLKAEVLDAETRAENETQKYANELTLVLKQNNELRKRKQEAERKFREAQEGRSKLLKGRKSDVHESDVSDSDEPMSEAPETGDLDSVLEQEMNDRKSRKNDSDTQE